MPSDPSTYQIITGGALAIMVLREVFGFLKSRRENGHEPDPAIMAKLAELQKDTETIRRYCHDIINISGALKGATDLLLRALDDNRRSR